MKKQAVVRKVRPPRFRGSGGSPERSFSDRVPAVNPKIRSDRFDHDPNPFWNK